MKKKIETFVLGQISYNSLRHFILDRQLKTEDVVQVDAHAFDDLVLEYRDFYNSSMTRDIKILGIKIEESFDFPAQCVRVVSVVP